MTELELERYPVLRGLLGELRRLAVSEGLQEARRRREGLRVEAGRDLTRVEAPWLGTSYWLTAPQREVVGLLLAARLESNNPDVEERVLLRRAKASGVRRLAELFAGHPAWGELILPGARPATYRLADGGDDAPADAVRVEPED